MEFISYSEEYKNIWDDFISKSKNGTFHLKRDFIEYHKNRFTDASLLCFNNGNLLAVIPANKTGEIIYSHQGLTYGGVVVEKDIYLTSYISLFCQLLKNLKETGFEKFIIKQIPWTYTSVINDDFIYCMQLANARILKFDVLPHINIANRLEYQERRKRSIKKALKNNFTIQENEKLFNYWELLKIMLSTYNATPVHSLEEITYLKEKFPDNIRLFEVYEGNNLLAGILIFETAQVARAQYIASSAKGKETGALDLLFDYLIKDKFANKSYFDFGTTTLEGGSKLNYGLSDQKEGFGARTIVQLSFEINLKILDFKNFENLAL